ncbi:glycosyltransferase family 2 protein [uncultured Litoreibacter sp.]|uniref:glycosyltransferase family 2 protein n=1 Tax=uncultured Litoreibacter sp. TaxID=1392394 RepID=UPI0026314D9C|nr:glycosyltransferase family 2 protein [uncultured Litoreibacter sp.]
MTLAMTLLVRDEVDIVRENIEFHLRQGVDLVVAIDNGSVDGTRDILDEYQRAGVATVFDEAGRDYAQSKWVTKAALYARDALGAEWVLNNDADEFWVPRRGNLKDVIAAYPDASQLNVSRWNMVADHHTLGQSGWREELIYRAAYPLPRTKWQITDLYEGQLPAPYFLLDLPGKALVRTAGLQKVTQGNHSAHFSDEQSHATPPIQIFHYPVRSPKQFEKKVDQGGQAYLANRELPESVGWHWRRWYRMYLEHGIEAPLRDALPSGAQLRAGLAAGDIVREEPFLVPAGLDA